MKPLVPNDENLKTWESLLLTDKSFQYALYRELRDRYLHEQCGVGLLFTYVHWLQQLRQDWQFSMDESQHDSSKRSAYSALIDNWDNTVPYIVLQSLDVHETELSELLAEEKGCVGQRMHVLVVETRQKFGGIESQLGLHPEGSTKIHIDEVDDDHDSPGVVDLFYS